MSVPARVHEEETFDQFWEQLSWDKLERKIRIALRCPGQDVTLYTKCPAVMDLAKQIMEGIGKSAIQRPGEMVTQEETFSFDQRLVLLRILEAIISEYEDWKAFKFHAGKHAVWDFTTPSLPQK